MPKMVSFVFKVLIMTLIIATFVTLAASIIDIFITTTRIQSLAQMIQYDVAQNNCLLNDTYNGFKGELYDISMRSNHMKVCYGGDGAAYEPVINGNTKLSGKPALELFKATPGATPSQRYIQLGAHDTGVLLDGYVTTLKPKEFGVANYGDILQLNINTVINPTMFTMPTGGGSMTDASRFALNGRGGSPLTLKFTIPALTYIK